MGMLGTVGLVDLYGLHYLMDLNTGGYFPHTHRYPATCESRNVLSEPRDQEVLNWRYPERYRLTKCMCCDEHLQMRLANADPGNIIPSYLEGRLFKGEGCIREEIVLGMCTALRKNFNLLSQAL